MGISVPGYLSPGMVEVARWVANREYMSHGTATEVKVSGECMWCAVILWSSNRPVCLASSWEDCSEAPAGRVNGPSLQLTLVCEMCRWNVHQSNVVRMKNLRQKEKKNQLVFTSLTLARSGRIRCSIELEEYGVAKGLGTWWPRSLPGPSCYMCWMASKKEMKRPRPEMFSGRWRVQQGQEARFRKRHHAN